MSTNIYEISDANWKRIKDMLQLEITGNPGRPCQTTNRQVMNGALWINHTNS